MTGDHVIKPGDLVTHSGTFTGLSQRPGKTSPYNPIVTTMRSGELGLVVAVVTVGDGALFDEALVLAPGPRLGWALASQVRVEGDGDGRQQTHDQ